MAFYSLEGKDINASDPEWWKYSDEVIIPKGVDIYKRTISYYQEESDFILHLRDDSENLQASEELRQVQHQIQDKTERVRQEQEDASKGQKADSRKTARHKDMKKQVQYSSKRDERKASAKNKRKEKNVKFQNE